MQDWLFVSLLTLAFQACTTLQHCDSSSPVLQYHVTHDLPNSISLVVLHMRVGAESGRDTEPRRQMSLGHVPPSYPAPSHPGVHTWDNGEAQIQRPRRYAGFQCASPESTSILLYAGKCGLVCLHFPSLIFYCLLWGQREGHKEGSCKNLHVPL